MSGDQHLVAAPVEIPAKAAEPVACCVAWGRLPADKREIWCWQVLHQLAHSPVPFNRSQLIELARVTRFGAEVLIAYGHDHRWITRVTPSRKGHDALWRGVLDRPDYRHRNPARGT